MNFSERNKKVAISRWNKIISKEEKEIPNDESSLLSKSLLCGLLAGDGSVQIRKEKKFYHYQLDFFPDNKEMLELYCSLIKKLYHKEPTIREKIEYAHRVASTGCLRPLTLYE